MRLKKLFALLLAGTMSASLLTGCGGGGKDSNASDQEQDTSGGQTAADSDLAYIRDKGTLVIGVTEFDPMDYHEKGSDEWIGFDAELAKAFAQNIGVSAEFIEIDWNRKQMELDTKAIDAVWNGMTLTDEVTNSMNCSIPYCENVQVVVVPKEKANQYQTLDSVKDLQFAAEAGSAGAAVGAKLNLNVTEVGMQTDAMMEASTGASDACIVDRMMAVALTGEGDSYSNLTYTVNLNEASGDSTEHYGVGFRKDSDLTDAFNTFYKEAYADGTVKKIAETYHVEDAILAPQ